MVKYLMQLLFLSLQQIPISSTVLAPCALGCQNESGSRAYSLCVAGDLLLNLPGLKDAFSFLKDTKSRTRCWGLSEQRSPRKGRLAILLK